MAIKCVEARKKTVEWMRQQTWLDGELLSESQFKEQTDLCLQYFHQMLAST